MIKQLNKYIYIFVILFIIPAIAVANDTEQTEAKTIRRERNLIRKGNKLYNEKRYAEAEVEYRKAINENKDSEIGLYNLAASLIKQGGSSDPKSKDNPLNQAATLLNDLAKISKDKQLTSKAFYNLGNMAYNQEQYQQAVDAYKNSLRRNPNDESTRQNLRLAQKKLQQQQDQNKDKDKKDQDKQNKDQDQDKNKDQQDKNKDNKDNQQNQNQQDKQDQNKDKQDKQNQSAGGQDNSEQILNAVQNNEKDTQQKVNKMRAKAQENERRRTQNQW